MRMSTVNYKLVQIDFQDDGLKKTKICKRGYCLTKISIRARRSISRVFSLFIVPSPFFVIAPTKAVLTELKAY